MTDVVERVDRNHRFVRGDLKDAVGGRVDDRRAGPHVLGAEPRDDLRARRHVVAERGALDAPFELADQVRGKSVGERRKRALEHEAHQLPVAGHRILAGRSLAHPSERRGGRRRRRVILQRDDAGQAERGERRDVQMDVRGEVAERVAARVAVGGGVGQFADPDAVEDDDDDPVRRRR